MNTAEFKIKQTYGKHWAYPQNEVAEALCTLINTKTWPAIQRDDGQWETAKAALADAAAVLNTQITISGIN